MKKTLSILLLLIFVFSAGCVNKSTTDGTTADNEETQAQKAEGFFPHTVTTDRKPYTAVEIPDVPNDPYSRVIREYYQLVLDESTDAQDDLNYFKYTLYDIDGDGTKELLLSGTNFREDPKDYKNTVLKHIFTLKDGAAFEVKLPIDQFSEEDRPDLAKITYFTVYTNGLISVSTDKNMYHFKYENGTMTYVLDRVYRSKDTEYPYTTYYDYYASDETGKRQKIDRENSKKLQEELRSGAMWIEFVWLPLESYRCVKQAREYYYLVVKQLYDRLTSSSTTDEKSLEYALNNHFYAFHDIDGNGTEEMLFAVTESLWGSGYFSTRYPDLSVERGTVFYEVYSSDGESVKKAPCIPDIEWDSYFYNLGGRDVLTNGLIRLYGGTPKHVSYTYFKYSDGEIEFINELLCGEEKMSLTYYDNGNKVRKDITQKEFDRIKAETEDGAETVDIEWHTLKSFSDKNS